jgi:MoaE-MoaD fusion protein
MPETITIRHFAVVKEITGRAEETREINPGATANDILESLTIEFPRLKAVRRSAMVMVNHSYADLTTELHDGDELAFIPPVSGGSPVRLFRVTADVLDAREAEAAVRDASCGAILTFIGEVRDFARGESVTALDYEAYAEAAVHMMATIADEIVANYAVERIAILHRTGLLKPGDASVVISVAAPHRDAAYDASRHAIERIKQIVPIWKKEHYADGTAWIGSEAEYQKDLGRS